MITTRINRNASKNAWGSNIPQTLSSLPLELWNRIFAFLPDEDLVRCCRVSSSFYSMAAAALYYSIRLTRANYKSVMKNVRFVKHLQSNQINEMDDYVTDEEDVHYSKNLLNITEVTLIFKKMTNLQTLKIHSHDKPSVLAYTINSIAAKATLKKLLLDYAFPQVYEKCRYAIPHDLFKHFSPSIKIEVLTSDVTFMEGLDKSLKNAATSITFLSICIADFATPLPLKGIKPLLNSIEDLLPHLTNLEKLVLGGPFWHITNILNIIGRDDMIRQVKELQLVEHMIAKKFKHKNNKSLPMLLQLLPKLSSLESLTLPILDVPFVDSLPKCLKKLSIRGFHDISILSHIRNHCINLCSFNWTGMDESILLKLKRLLNEDNDHNGMSVLKQYSLPNVKIVKIDFFAAGELGFGYEEIEDDEVYVNPSKVKAFIGPFLGLFPDVHDLCFECDELMAPQLQTLINIAPMLSKLRKLRVFPIIETKEAELDSLLKLLPHLNFLQLAMLNGFRVASLQGYLKKKYPAITCRVQGQVLIGFEEDYSDSWEDSDNWEDDSLEMD